MKGITPVIAIILLLLMTVAAAGGFYFVYQSFSEKGSSSGTSQMDQLSETAGSAIDIESVGSGKIYVRNVGSTTIDASKITVYVDDVPVAATVSTNSVAEGGRVTITLNETPTCSGTKCKIKIAGAASTSKSVDSDKLATAGCGDGICATDEDGMTCFEDCAPSSLPLTVINLGTNAMNLYEYTWDGSTYNQGSALTSTDDAVSLNTAFDDDGNGIAMGAVGDGDTSELIATHYTGSSWSSISENLTSNTYRDQWGMHMSDFMRNSGDAVALWAAGSTNASTMIYDTDAKTWGDVSNITENYEGFRITDPAISCKYLAAHGDVCGAIWTSYTSNNQENSTWVNGTFYMNDAWGEVNNYTFLNSSGVYKGPDVDFNSTHILMTWIADYGFETYDGEIVDDQVVQYMFAPFETQVDGQPIFNLTGLGKFQSTDLILDGNGNWLLIVLNSTGGEGPLSAWPEYYTMDAGEDTWTYGGNVSSSDSLGYFIAVKNQNDAIFGSVLISDTYTYWTGTEWADEVALG